MKKKLEKITSSSDYIKALADGHTEVTEVCVVKVMQLTCSTEINKHDYHTYL